MIRAMLVGGALIASSQTVAAADPGWNETPQADGSTIGVPAETPTDKETWQQAHPDGEPVDETASSSEDIPGDPCGSTERCTASTIGATSLTSTGRTYMRNSSASVKGSTAIRWQSYPCANYVTFSNSNIHAYWWGSSPVNANKISLTAKWWLTGVSVSGVQIPTGASFSSSGSSVTWNPGDVPNTWAAHGYYSSAIKLKACYTYKANYQTASDVLLYTTWYHVQGN